MLPPLGHGSSLGESLPKVSQPCSPHHAIGRRFVIPFFVVFRSGVAGRARGGARARARRRARARARRRARARARRRARGGCARAAAQGGDRRTTKGRARGRPSKGKARGRPSKGQKDDPARSESIALIGEGRPPPPSGRGGGTTAQGRCPVTVPRPSLRERWGGTVHFRACANGGGETRPSRAWCRRRACSRWLQCRAGMFAVGHGPGMFGVAAAELAWLA